VHPDLEAVRCSLFRLPNLDGIAHSLIGEWALPRQIAGVVAVKRWQAFTGHAAMLLTSGQTFDVVGAKRLVQPEPTATSDLSQSAQSAGG
jgi:hypothetical protein